jgi:hypothetical protein
MEILFSCKNDYSAHKSREDFSIRDQANNNEILDENALHHYIEEEDNTRNMRTYGVGLALTAYEHRALCIYNLLRRLHSPG